MCAPSSMLFFSLAAIAAAAVIAVFFTALFVVVVRLALNVVWLYILFATRFHSHAKAYIKNYLTHSHNSLKRAPKKKIN